MKYSFECEIEANHRMEIVALLQHIADDVDGGFYHGGYDWCCADYSWSLQEDEDYEDDDYEEDESDPAIE